MHPRLRIALTILGWILVGLGVIGLLLPFLQGLLFIVLGLYLLSFNSSWAKRNIKRLRQKYPKAKRMYDSIDLKIRKFFGMNSKDIHNNL